MSTERWAAQAPFFGENHRVLLHDFRGQGKSTLLSEGITFETHARDMAMLLDALGIDRLHIVGVSYGAEVGMYFALMYPERVKSLTLGTAVSESDPFLKAMIESSVKDFYALLDAFTRSVNLEGAFNIELHAYELFRRMREENISEYLVRGLRAFFKIEEKHIGETLFFYPLIGILNKLSYELA